MNLTNEVDCTLISSNLGLYPNLSSFPYNKGLLKAPYYIVEHSSLNQFQCSAFDMRIEPGLSNEEFYSELSEQISKCSEDILNNFCSSNQHIYLGGDHSITYLSLLASVSNYNGSNRSLGYVQIDSHADMNLWQTSPSKNFHGMFLRPFLDPNFDIPCLESLITQKMDPSQILFIGNLDLDPEEEAFFTGNKIKNITKEAHYKKPSESLEVIRQFAKRFTHLHISFDIDVFHKKLVSSTSTVAKEGWDETDVFVLLDALFEHPHCSLDIVEFNAAHHEQQQDHSLRLVNKVINNFILSRNRNLCFL